MAEKVERSESEWKAQLTAEQYRICRRKGTERAFSGKYNGCKEEGVYHCVCCGQPLFRSETKFESGSGWPSFYQPIDEDNVEQVPDNSFFMRRTEVVCGACDA